MRPRTGPTTESVSSLLADLDEQERETIELRLERWSDDLVDALTLLYPGHDVSALTLRLVESAIAGFRAREPELRHLDQRRLLRPDWLQQPDMLGYACYTERFADTLAGIPSRLPYLRDLGVTYLHLMPLLQPREGDNDGGYAVQDYRTVRSDLGDVDDLRELTRTLRGHGVSLVLDLVLNHVAREHEWARRARAGESRYRDYFHVFADREMPNAYESTLPEVFPDFAPGNFTWDAELDAWVWTTFNEWQWDLNWANPDVLVELADVVLHLANLGVEVLRLDAIAFTWKRLGTNCQNQPEVHAVTQALRTVARIAAPALAFKAEAIVGPRDLVQYLGQGRHAGRVSDLAYHNSLMVQVWSMLATGSTLLAKQALGALPTTPPSGTWICYVRCHDDIGWAIDDGDAAAVGLNGWEHRRFLSDWYAGDFPGSWARGLVFQHNPATGDKRISGTAAALVGLSDAPGRRGRGVGPGPALPRARDRRRLGRHTGRVERRRARPAQRPPLGRRARPRGRQPVGAPGAHRLDRGGLEPRPRHACRAGLPGSRAPRAGPGGPAAAARLGRDGGADRHRGRRARRAARPPERADGVRLQRHGGVAPCRPRPLRRPPVCASPSTRSAGTPSTPAPTAGSP